MKQGLASEWIGNDFLVHGCVAFAGISIVERVSSAEILSESLRFFKKLRNAGSSK
jgi:hypothetical protein